MIDTKRESDIQREIIEYLRLCGCFVLRLNAGKVQHNVSMCPPGTPDLEVVCPGGRVIWIEVKRPGKHLSEDQMKMHEFLEVLNQEVIVAYDVSDVEEIVQ